MLFDTMPPSLLNNLSQILGKNFKTASSRRHGTHEHKCQGLRPHPLVPTAPSPFSRGFQITDFSDGHLRTGLCGVLELHIMEAIAFRNLDRPPTSAVSCCNVWNRTWVIAKLVGQPILGLIDQPMLIYYTTISDVLSVHAWSAIHCYSRSCMHTR